MQKFLAAIDSGSPFEDVFRIRRPDGEIRFIAGRGQVVESDAAGPTRMIGVNFDVTDRARAEQSVRENEARLRTLIDSGLSCIAVLDDEGRVVDANRPFLEAGGLQRADVVGLPLWTSSCWSGSPDAAARLKSAIRRLRGQAPTLIRKGESVRWEEELQLGESGRRTVLLGLFPSVDEHGSLQQIILSGLDITDRKDAEARLEATAQTFRQMVDHSPFGILVVDADFRLVRASEGGQKAFGENAAPVGRDFADIQRDLWPEPYASEIIARFRHTLATGEPYQAPSRLECRADNGAAEAYDWRIERIILPDGRPGVVCHFYDLSERQRHEEQVKLLMHELNHRSKNMLSLVQAIARQTAAGGTEAFVRRFGERLKALAAAQDLLVRHAWTSVPVDELVRSQLAHLVGTPDERVALDGPPLRLSVAAAQALGLALHELATNATKYGALSVDGGRVRMTWGVGTEEDDAAQFFMTWEEHDGPPVAEPDRRGFGTTVITRMVEMNLGGSVALDYAAAGIVWRMECPAARVVEGDAGDEGPAPGGRQSDGRRVLVVEDELLIATEIGRYLSEAGFEVIGPVRNVGEAMTALAQEECDLAVLDVNLGDETSEEVARELAVRKTPFIAVSGRPRKDMPPVLKAAPHVPKPVNENALLQELERCLVRRRA